jgi:hypothetical protein
MDPERIRERAMHNQHTVLGLEELGGRVLPSSTMVPTPPGVTTEHVRFDERHEPGHPADPGHIQQHAPVHAGEMLEGAGGGFYLTGVKTSSGGTESRLYGQAYLSGIGAVTVTGTVWTVGSSAGEAGGVLTFRNTDGSITIALEGAKQPAGAHLPATFHYEVIEGTGAYRHFHETGRIHLDLDPSRAIEGKHHGGDFTFTIGSLRDVDHHHNVHHHR